eukprot:TRINITY_DN694_c1_g1_i1.p3 TRINITY_DN694_c1_g1~~TRINITY_DN694_c1_g1_i1.p3  ORF type:complete len:222 (-),score=13.44 TRINITY_DN694_c1_g1_i1:784-1449(-)
MHLVDMGNIVERIELGGYFTLLFFNLKLNVIGRFLYQFIHMASLGIDFQFMLSEQGKLQDIFNLLVHSKIFVFDDIGKIPDSIGIANHLGVVDGIGGQANGGNGGFKFVGDVIDEIGFDIVDLFLLENKDYCIYKGDNDEKGEDGRQYQQRKYGFINQAEMVWKGEGKLCIFFDNIVGKQFHLVVGAEQLRIDGRVGREDDFGLLRVYDSKIKVGVDAEVI